MSAESPAHRVRTQSTRPGTGKIQSTITPQQVTDPTILDSVAGFINDALPSSYNIPEVDDQIQWVHFEQIDYDCIGDDDGGIQPPAPLILILGYTNGIQVWAIPSTGEATEILSWRHGCVRALRFIPNPYKIGSNDIDFFAASRPLIALTDSSSAYTALTFRSLKVGIHDPAKQIQFKSPILNILANRHSVVVTFSEKLAVFDAFTLESRISVTTCFLSPGIQPNPVALGPRWLAYAEKKLNGSQRSSGGNEGEGQQSVTASVLNAAKSLGRGLRELTDAVAGSLTGGNQGNKPGMLPSSPQAGGLTDIAEKGVVTILDIENNNIDTKENLYPNEAVIAHFVAHTEAIVCLSFDPSGMLLLTADKRGHDFHLFRIQPHPGGSSLAAVHHLYVLHRGDTSAKVQDMCFSCDSRWVTVSTLRGTTHVFPITPYGGNINVRTHISGHVVNKMSRYQRSAGLTIEGRSSSPVTMSEQPTISLYPYRNPRFQPYPVPLQISPYAQIRQPVYIQNTSNTQPRTHSGRQRLPSSSEENISLRVVATFAQPRAWMEPAPSKLQQRDVVTQQMKQQIKPCESLFIISCHGILIQYDLEPIPIQSAREKICNDTAIELKVYAKAQWPLHRNQNSIEVLLPMTKDNLNLLAQSVPQYKQTKPDHNDEQWLSQVEIVTHLGPHRRLWMGPQFTFKTYLINNGAVVETKPLDVGRSKPVNMPVSKANAILIESGSASSCEQLFLDTYQKSSEEVGSVGDLRLREDLADAMLESPGSLRETGGHCVIVSMRPQSTRKVVNPLGTVVTIQSDDEIESEAVEDAVIHENCDEALFRPVVTPKVFYSENNKPKSCPTDDNILTKSLEANTEVAVKIINRNKTNINNNNNKKTSSNKQQHINKIINSRETSPKNNKKIVDKEKTPPPPVITTTTKSVKNKKLLENIDNTDFVPISKQPITQSIPSPPPLVAPSTDFDILSINQSSLVENEKDNIFDSFNDIIDKSTFIESNSTKYEKFEDAEDCGEKFDKYSSKTTTTKLEPELLNSSEEEKIVVTKKTRKPKTKLGVKIGSNKDKEATPPPLSSQQPLPPPILKKSWNIVAGGRIPDKDVEIIEINTEQEPEPQIEFEETYTFKLPQINKNNDDNLINIDDDSGGNDPIIVKEMDLLKIDKSSDDEKGGCGSSPTETTESDDSTSKIPIVIDDGEVENEEANSQPSKTSTRKKSRKRREQAQDMVGKDVEDVSSASSFSSASRASPTPSYGDNFIHFPGDSSSSM